MESPLNAGDKVAAGVYLDAVYAPPKTPFLQRGETEGVLWVNGRGHMMGSTALHCSYILGVPISLDEVRAVEHRSIGLVRASPKAPYTREGRESELSG